MFYFLLLITSYNAFISSRYILKLKKDHSQGKYIYKDEMHTLQHIAIAGITTVLSIAMLFWSCSEYTELIYVLYNLSILFIIYPHLKSEE
jgi:hypothetical protein